MLTEKQKQFNKIEINGYTGEKVALVKIKCRCGHTLSFLSNHSKICDFCGIKVYPTKICEFREKMELERRKCK